MMFNNKRFLFVTSLLFCMMLPTAALGDPVYVHVSDMSQVHYQLTADGKVYFRNLNQFRSSVTGCCYAFYLDTTTEFGKSAWAVILMKMASKQPLSLHVTESNPPTSGNPARVDHLGNW